MTDKLKPCPFCGGNHPSHAPGCALIDFCNGAEITSEAWNNRPVEEAQEGIIAILELFRDDAKSVAEEAMTMLKEIAFHGSTPERRQRVVDDLQKIVSRGEK